jgi:hypothetical protein
MQNTDFIEVLVQMLVKITPNELLALGFPVPLIVQRHACFLN